MFGSEKKSNIVSLFSLLFLVNIYQKKKELKVTAAKEKTVIQFYISIALETAIDLVLYVMNHRGSPNKPAFFPSYQQHPH